MQAIKEVLLLTAAGLRQRQIARSLHLSHGVVAKYQAAAHRAVGPILALWAILLCPSILTLCPN